MTLATTQQTVRMARPGKSKARFNPLRKNVDKTVGRETIGLVIMTNLSHGAYNSMIKCPSFMEASSTRLLLYCLRQLFQCAIF